MDLGLNIRHQNGADYDELRTGVAEAERLGFAMVSFPDHYVAIEHIRTPDGGRDTAAITSPTGASDAWTVIAALIMTTSTLRFATMMTSSTFRHPGPLAVSVAELARFSAGRVTLGIGTNWHEHEHLALGIPYTGQAGRFERLEEQLRLINGLWTSGLDGQFDFDGTYYTVRDGTGILPPGAPVPRIVIGGSGLKRTPRLAATFADEVNTLARTPDAAVPFWQACDAACERLGRDPATLRRSVLMPVCCGEDDADIDRHLRAAGLTRDQIDPSIICGPDELVERLGNWSDAGVDLVVLSRRGAVDLPSIRLLGDRVVGAVS